MAVRCPRNQQRAAVDGQYLHISTSSTWLTLLSNTRRRRATNEDPGNSANEGRHHDTAPIDPELLQIERAAAMARNVQLEMRLAALETQVAGSGNAQGAARGHGVGTQARGGRRPNRQPRNAMAVQEDEADGPQAGLNDVFHPDPNAEKDDFDPLILVDPKHKRGLSILQRKAIAKCQVRAYSQGPATEGTMFLLVAKAAVQTAFRQVTGVLTTQDPWPKWTQDSEWTGSGMAVNLEGMVTHPINRVLFRRVAEVAMQDLKVR